MTDLLHMRDNYLREFNALIQEIGEDYLILDRTAFYPLGGGQASDTGRISKDNKSIRIHEVRKAEGDICHFTSNPIPFSKGDTIHGELDWNFRYECMRFHTCQHVLSRYLQLHYDVETVGNMITPEQSRADYSPLESFDDEMKRKVEKGVNDILSQALPVEIRFMARADAIKFLNEKGYQTRYLEMVPKSVKEFRVLTIGNYDAASCAGTHVANTSEIGNIRIGKSKNVGAGKRRIYFTLDKP